MFRKSLVCAIVILFVGIGLIPCINGNNEIKRLDSFIKSKFMNERPSAPLIDGPTHVRVGVENTWSFISIDPDGDNITYYVDWGDKCGGAEYHGPYPSGQEVNLSHKYMNKNILIINALAIDSQGAESELTFFEVEISRNKAFTNNIILHKLFWQFAFMNIILNS